MRDLSVEGIDIMIALDLSTSMEAADFRPAEPPQRRQGGAHRLHLEPGERPHRPGGVLRRGLHAGAAHARLRRAQGGRQAAAHPRARGRHRHRRRARRRRSTACATRDAKSRVVVLITDGDNNAGQDLAARRGGAWPRRCTSPSTPSSSARAARCPSPIGTDIFGNTAWREVEIPINPELLQDIAARDRRRVTTAPPTARRSRTACRRCSTRSSASKLLEGGATADVPRGVPRLAARRRSCSPRSSCCCAPRF